MLRITRLVNSKRANPRHAAQVGAARRAGLFPFVAVMYSYTTGGPFGLEDQVATSGPGMTLIYHLVLPLFWCIPISLVAAELTTAMPVQGGFYRWSRAAFGDFWGFLAGWWNWCGSFLLGGAYAVLFADYVGFCFPNMRGWTHYALAVALVALVAWVNIRGIRLVGSVATALEFLVLVPVAGMCLASVRLWHHNPFVPLVPPRVPLFQVFGVGLALGLWLYSGYEQLSTVAGELEDPQRNYPRALAWVVPLSIATYFIPTACALAALNDWQDWRTRFFSDAGQLIGGPWLGLSMTIAATVTQAAILNSTILASTRLPAAMAEDGYVPKALARIHPRYGTPWIAILVSSAVYAALAFQSLTELVSVYMWLRIGTSSLTVLAAWKLRRSRPELARGFRIPFGNAGLAYAVIAPLAMGGAALLASDHFALLWGPASLLLGPMAYAWLRRSRQEALTNS
jgi:amino acid transporter